MFAHFASPTISQAMKLYAALVDLIDLVPFIIVSFIILSVFLRVHKWLRVLHHSKSESKATLNALQASISRLQNEIRDILGETAKKKKRINRYRKMQLWSSKQVKEFQSAIDKQDEAGETLRVRVRELEMALEERRRRRDGASGETTKNESETMGDDQETAVEKSQGSSSAFDLASYPAQVTAARQAQQLVVERMSAKTRDQSTEWTGIPDLKRHISALEKLGDLRLTEMQVMNAERQDLEEKYEMLEVNYEIRGRNLKKREEELREARATIEELKLALEAKTTDVENTPSFSFAPVLTSTPAAAKRKKRPRLPSDGSSRRPLALKSSENVPVMRPVAVEVSRIPRPSLSKMR